MRTTITISGIVGLLLIVLLLKERRLEQRVATLEHSLTAKVEETLESHSKALREEVEKLRREGNPAPQADQFATRTSRLANTGEGPDAAVANVEGWVTPLEGTRRVDAQSSFPGILEVHEGDTPESEPGVSAHELAAAKGRNWGWEQAVGAPDTGSEGDIVTAWAPKTPDGGEEWLKLDYPQAVELAEISIWESYNPGAISKVAAVLGDGQEQIVWEGVMEAKQGVVETIVPVAPGVYAGSVKVYLDTSRVAGWNEIDAVELVGLEGSRQWAVGATASSSYADK